MGGLVDCGKKNGVYEVLSIDNASLDGPLGI
jgi:hypothetical protein